MKKKKIQIRKRDKQNKWRSYLINKFVTIILISYIIIIIINGKLKKLIFFLFVFKENLKTNKRFEKFVQFSVSFLFFFGKTKNLQKSYNMCNNEQNAKFN